MPGVIACECRRGDCEQCAPQLPCVRIGLHPTQLAMERDENGQCWLFLRPGGCIVYRWPLGDLLEKARRIGWRE